MSSVACELTMTELGKSGTGKFVLTTGIPKSKHYGETDN